MPAADGIAFQTARSDQATTIVGPATLDLWVKAPVQVEDFQATITEVRPSTAQEEYITSGFLRSSNQVDGRLHRAVHRSDLPGRHARRLSPT